MHLRLQSISVKHFIVILGYQLGVSKSCVQLSNYCIVKIDCS